MDIETLKQLGVSPDDLAERIIDQTVHVLLNTTGFDPDSEEEHTYDSKFKKEVEKRVQAAVDTKISALAAEHILPRVGEMIETADMRQTNRYGEPKSPPMSFKEYIAYRADMYMREEVDYHGRSKADLEANGDSTYDWRASGSRLTVLMRNYIRETLETHAKAAVNDVNKAIAANLEKAAKDAITQAAGALKVAVSA
jgi:hypothetical protein